MTPANVTTTEAPKNSSFNWADFFSFKTMITLRIIQILYVVVAVVLTIYSLTLLFKSNDRYGYNVGPNNTILGLALLVLGNVGWRIWCELMIVIFRVNKSLNNIDINTKK